MPVARTAERAAATSVPCTRTVVGTAAPSVDSWWLRKAWTGARDGVAGAAWAGTVAKTAATTAATLPTPSARRDRLKNAPRVRRNTALCGLPERARRRWVTGWYSSGGPPRAASPGCAGCPGGGGPRPSRQRPGPRRRTPRAPRSSTPRGRRGHGRGGLRRRPAGRVRGAADRPGLAAGRRREGRGHRAVPRRVLPAGPRAGAPGAGADLPGARSALPVPRRRRLPDPPGRPGGRRPQRAVPRRDLGAGHRRARRRAGPGRGLTTGRGGWRRARRSPAAPVTTSLAV